MDEMEKSRRSTGRVIPSARGARTRGRGGRGRGRGGTAKQVSRQRPAVLEDESDHLSTVSGPSGVGGECSGSDSDGEGSGDDTHV